MRAPSRDKQAALRTLATSLGVTIERAPMRDSWFLTNEAGERLVSDRGTTAFLTARAIAHLKKLKSQA